MLKQPTEKQKAKWRKINNARKYENGKYQYYLDGKAVTRKEWKEANQ